MATLCRYQWGKPGGGKTNPADRILGGDALFWGDVRG